MLNSRRKYRTPEEITDTVRFTIMQIVKDKIVDTVRTLSSSVLPYDTESLQKLKEALLWIEQIDHSRELQSDGRTWREMMDAKAEDTKAAIRRIYSV